MKKDTKDVRVDIINKSHKYIYAQFFAMKLKYEIRRKNPSFLCVYTTINSYFSNTWLISSMCTTGGDGSAGYDF
jgi:hypothetical protein